MTRSRSSVDSRPDPSCGWRFGILPAEDRRSSVGRASVRLRRRYRGPVRPPNLIDRLRALDQRLVDALIALAFAGLIALQFVSSDHPGSEPNAVNLVGGLLLALPLAWRRRAPMAMICAFVAAGFANEALGGGLFSFPAPGDADGTPPFGSLVTAVVAFYSLGAHAGERESAVGVAIGTAGFWAMVIVSGQVDFGSFFFSTALAVAPWLVGRNARARSLRLAAAQREQAQRTRLAVSDERARIARELHDVVAHSVGVIVVQAEGARRVFERDPDRAREALDSIEQTARTALADMRRSLGVLRRESGKAELEPQPGIDDLGELLERARGGGLAVELAVEGEPTPLPQGVDLSAYRIVQEALTNAIKHAGPVRTQVTVRYGERQLELEVADDGPGPSPNGAESKTGHGLAGMRERVAAHGGALQTGAGPQGGFLVRASLPLSR
jgi:signal transduction histidine kinase